MRPPLPAAVLLDLDGTLYTDAGPVPGGLDAIAALRWRGIPFCCVSNTTSRPRTGIVLRLEAMGYDIAIDEIVTPIQSAITYCVLKGFRTVAPLVPAATLEELVGVELIPMESDRAADAVLVGDLGEAWSYPLLQRAFTRIRAGATLLALTRDRFYQRGGELVLDAGLFVAGLEFATGRAAIVLGKPAPDFFEAALASLNLSATDRAGQIVMVGDDLHTDVGGAMRAGLEGWLVRTGKFREEQLREGEVVPTRVIDSVADLVDAL